MDEVPEVGNINAVLASMSCKWHISLNIHLFPPKTEIATFCLFMVGNFVPINRIIRDTAAMEFAPTAQGIFSVIKFMRKLTMEHYDHRLSLEVRR